MLYQKWVGNPSWEETDPKLSQLRDSPVVLPHTKRLVDSIPIKPPGMLFVRGPRQAGKSTFLRQFAQKGLSRSLPPKSIALIEAESLESRHDLQGEIQGFRDSRQGFLLVLIDEITSIEKWWLALKLAADQGIAENMLIVCTGSSAEDLSESADLLPGRRGKRYPLDFELLPVRYKDVSRRMALEDFLVTGGFPWAIREYLRFSAVPPYVYEIYSAWVQGALAKRRYSLQNIPPMFRYLAERVGTGLSVPGLARDCGLGSNHTAENYLHTLELNYALLTCRWSEPGSGVAAPRKNRKFYPSDPLLFHLFHDFAKGMDSTFIRSRQRLSDPKIMGALVECLAASELRHSETMFPLHYFLGKKEIDFVGKEAVEIKYQNRVELKEFAWTEKVLPGGMGLTVVTRQTRSRMGSIRAVPLKEWLLENK